MKRILFIILLFSIFLLSAPVFASETLQAQIDKTPINGMLTIEPGTYEENIAINKPMKIDGNDKVIIRSCHTKPVVTIAGTSVHLQNIKIEQCSNEGDIPAVQISGSNHSLEKFGITTEKFGINLSQADHVVLDGGMISGEQTGSGIDLWESDSNTISNMQIRHVEDGIYLERSHNNHLLTNEISDSRYGMHLMYSNDTVLEGNSSKRNITGAMIMVTDRTLVKGNTLSENSKNVNAQGLLLYDAVNTQIIKNTISSNRLGVYIENSEHNLLTENEVNSNFIGVIFKNANNNEMHENNMIANVNTVQAINSDDNDVSQNFWDSSWKVDKTRSGVSSIPYQADPFLLTLTSQVPAYQLFFQSPGMVILEALLKSPPEVLLTDEMPLMKSSSPKPELNSQTTHFWFVSFSLIAISLFLFIWGRRRT